MTSKIKGKAAHFHFGDTYLRHDKTWGIIVNKRASEA